MIANFMIIDARDKSSLGGQQNFPEYDRLSWQFHVINCLN